MSYKPNNRATIGQIPDALKRSLVMDIQKKITLLTMVLTPGEMLVNIDNNNEK